jgi:hypothetical protein
VCANGYYSVATTPAEAALDLQPLGALDVATKIRGFNRQNQAKAQVNVRH